MGWSTAAMPTRGKTQQMTNVDNSRSILIGDDKPRPSPRDLLPNVLLLRLLLYFTPSQLETSLLYWGCLRHHPQDLVPLQSLKNLILTRRLSQAPLASRLARPQPAKQHHLLNQQSHFFRCAYAKLFPCSMVIKKTC